MKPFLTQVKFFYHLAIWLSVFVFAVWTTRAHIAPNGVFEVRLRAGDDSSWISRILPNGVVFLVGAKEEQVFSLKGERAYVDVVAPHRDFERVFLSGVIKPKTPLVFLGAEKSKVDEDIAWKPVFWKGFESRFKNGAKPTLGNQNARALSVFVERPAFAVTLSAPREIPVSIRGSHEIAVALGGGETLDFTFVFEDMNRHEGEDDITAEVWKGDKVIFKKSFPDDGNVSGNGASSPPKSMAIRLPNLSQGVYRLKLIMSGDAFVRKIKTPHGKFVFLNRLNLGDNVGSALPAPPPDRLVFSGTHLSAITSHAESREIIMAGEKKLNLEFTNAPVATIFNELAAPRRIITKNADVLLKTNGVFALNESQWFLPHVPHISWETDYSKNNFAVFAPDDFSPPKKFDGEFILAEANFDARQLARDKDGRYRFFLEAPGAPFLKGDVEIKEISVRFEGKQYTKSEQFYAILGELKRWLSQAKVKLSV